MAYNAAIAKPLWRAQTNAPAHGCTTISRGWVVLRVRQLRSTAPANAEKHWRCSLLAAAVCVLTNGAGASDNVLWRRWGGLTLLVAVHTSLARYRSGQTGLTVNQLA
jgi:hypothetical protein